jgi:GntR family transcriptional regulator / MocR family aminotransferase
MFLDLDGRGELYLQLLRALKRAILDGRLASGSRLPATRALADELGLSRNTVLAAYGLLCAEHLAIARGGSGTFVGEVMPREHRRPAVEHVPEPSRYAARLRRLPPLPLPMPRAGLRIDLQYGEPMTDLALFTAWGRSLSHAAAHAQTRYPHPQGLPELRSEIARHLSRRRGVVCDADDVIVVNGTQQAFALLARVLLDEGDGVVVEDPGYALASQCFAAHGATVMPVKVDDAGLDTGRLPADNVKLIAVTPSHQFPLGVALSLPRRMELLQFAARTHAWIVEDDYDGEFGFEGRMLPALRSLDLDGRVIYVGTFSKTILPSLRLGYIVCPRSLRSDLLLAKRLADIASSGIDQSALSHFMSTGGYDRHLRRTSLELRRRRKALVDGLTKHCSDQIELQDSGTGMHMIAWLPGLNATGLRSLISAAEQLGLGLHGLNGHYASPPPRSALLLGFAGASVPQIRVAARALANCLKEAHQTASASRGTDHRRSA